MNSLFFTLISGFAGIFKAVHNDGVLYYRVRIPSDENIRLVRSNIDGQGSRGIDIAYFADDDDEQNYYGPYYLEIEI
jgi:hypothetical protein